MLSDEERRRYARSISLPEIGEAGQERLRAARVLVVGAGGLGSPLITYLAASGIGTLGIVDDDRVELSNLPRQILYEQGDQGRLKAECARDRASELNPHVHVELHTRRVTAANAAELVRQYDVVADGSDNFATRFAVNSACLHEKKPLISAAIRAWQGQVAVFKPYLDGQPCYRCLVSAHPGDERGCSDAGVAGPFAGMVGTIQALEVMKEVLGIGTLCGKIFSLDARSLVTKTSLVMRDPACESCSPQ